ALAAHESSPCALPEAARPAFTPQPHSVRGPAGPVPLLLQGAKFSYGPAPQPPDPSNPSSGGSAAGPNRAIQHAGSLGGNTVILRLLLGGLLAACAGPVAAGEIYKCAQPDGSIAYSNVPCERGSKEVARRGYDEPVGPAASTGNQQVTPQPA